MASASPPGPPATPATADVELTLREMNEALLVSSVRQHELTEEARRAEAGLRQQEALLRSINEELRESEERYRTLFNSIDEGFCVVEVLFDEAGKPVDYRFVEANPGFEKQTGLRGVVGKRMREIAPDHEEIWFARYGKVATTGEAVRFINQAQALDGRWFDVYAFRVGGTESRKVATLFTDITARKLLEEKTKEQAKSLADLNRRKDEFLATLSHELRNPLASILNAIHLLRLQADPSSLQVEAQGMIHRQVAHLARLVDDLLEVSRISTGRIRLQTERTDLRAIVDRAIETIQAVVERKEQSLAKTLPDEPVCVQGDPVRLEQIVVNLLSNASKYTDRGGHIAVELRAESDRAELRVCDNGMGIAPEMLPRIFDLFTQADRSLDRSQGGLGIGLALVRSLVALHGGTVKVSSTLGEGSEFIVALPTASLPGASGATLRAERPTDARPFKVLVVDDNVDAATGVAMLLRAFGHDARLAHDGASAIQLALEYVPEIVLLDIGLPVMSGLEVAQWIREQPALRGVVLVALTGYGQDSDKQQSHDAGFDHHLVKPVDFTKIQAILSRAAQQLNIR